MMVSRTLKQHGTKERLLRTESSGDSLPSPEAAPSSKGAARENVSQACEQCRVRKMKCSGPPLPCARCRASGVTNCAIDPDLDGRRTARKRINEEVETLRTVLLGILEAMRLSSDAHLRDLAAKVGSETSVEQMIRHFPSVAEQRKGSDSEHVSSAKVTSPYGTKDPTSDPSMKGKAAFDPIRDTQQVRSDTLKEVRSDGFIDGHLSEPIAQSGDSPRSSGSHVTSDASHDCRNGNFGNLTFSSAICANGYPFDIQEQQMKMFNISEHFVLPMVNASDTLLSQAISTFRDSALHLLAVNYPTTFFLGEDEPNMDLLFRQRQDSDKHSVSNWVCQLVATFDQLSAAQQLWWAYLNFFLFKWLICPTAKHYEEIPNFHRPTIRQRLIPHDPVVDMVYPTSLREQILGTSCEVSSLAAGAFLSKEFLSCARQEQNWSYPSSLALDIPLLKGKLNFHS